MKTTPYVILINIDLTKNTLNKNFDAVILNLSVDGYG
jgi:hypothetical protein